MIFQIPFSILNKPLSDIARKNAKFGSMERRKSIGVFMNSRFVSEPASPAHAEIAGFRLSRLPADETMLLRLQSSAA